MKGDKIQDSLVEKGQRAAHNISNFDMSAVQGMVNQFHTALGFFLVMSIASMGLGIFYLAFISDSGSGPTTRLLIMIMAIVLTIWPVVAAFILVLTYVYAANYINT